MLMKIVMILNLLLVIKINNPLYLDDPLFLTNADSDDITFLLNAGQDDILLLNSEDVAFILANLDLDNPLLVSIADDQIPAFNVQKQGFQGEFPDNIILD